MRTLTNDSWIFDAYTAQTMFEVGGMNLRDIKREARALKSSPKTEGSPYKSKRLQILQDEFTKRTGLSWTGSQPEKKD